VTLIQGQGY